MKQVKAVIRHEQLEGVRDSLDKLGAHGITITEVKGSGQQRGYTETYRGTKAVIHFRPKIELTVVVHDNMLDQIIETIIDQAKTGEVGDGKIFVLPVEQAIRIRTGDRGDTAL
jgi:nitrogen regulatory protein P-II 1